MDLSLKRIGDKHLMEAFEEIGFKRSSLVKLNLCRLHMHVHTVSDLLDGTGDRLYRLSLKGTRNKWKINLFDWTIQNSPEKKY